MRVIWSQNIYCNYTCLESSFENMQIRLHIAQCNYICLMAWPHLLQAIKEKLKIGSPTGQISGEKIMQSSIFVNGGKTPCLATSSPHGLAHFYGNSRHHNFSGGKILSTPIERKKAEKVGFDHTTVVAIGCFF